MMQFLRKHFKSNAGDSNVSKMTWVALVFVVGAILLVMITSAFRGPINRWLSTVTNDWFADDNGKFVSNPYEHQVYYGDIDMDGDLDNDDVNAILQYTAQWSGYSDEQIERMDVNGDGTVNAQDATLVGQYYRGWDVTIRPAPENSPFIP